MVTLNAAHGFVLGASIVLVSPALAQEAGGIRGMVYDKEFESPLAAAQVLVVETGTKVTGTDQGNFVFDELPAGTYTLVFSKDGYTRQVKSNVVVAAGRMSEVDVWMLGEFEEMPEFVVQDLQVGTGTEAALLTLRADAPSLMDSIGADLMSRAGLSDAVSALRLVSGASVQDGKYAVIRGLPDRYVNSQMNGVRLPTADLDKRAVQLDQFPASVIESVQVSKTFTPDQQGDASGGAVNVVLKGVPNDTSFTFSSGTTYNTNTTGNSKFLTYRGGGVNELGINESRGDFSHGNPGGAGGVTVGDAPIDYKWSLAGGGKVDLEDGFKFGGFANLFYERSSSFHDDGINDSYWLLANQTALSPKTSGDPGSELTSLYDVTQGSQEVKWGSLGTIGLESDHHSLTFAYLYTRAAEDSATRLEDTRGKNYYFGADYDPNDPNDPGNQAGIDTAHYQRLETLSYNERTTETLQLRGKHTLPTEPWGFKDALLWLSPEIDWTLAKSTATFYEPDKRVLEYQYNHDPGFPLQIPPNSTQGSLGFAQRVWKDMSESSEQYFLNLKLPFEQWTGSKGYLKFGVFNDEVRRNYRQDTYSNNDDPDNFYLAPWDQPWSETFDWTGRPFVASNIDVAYKGDQRISAWYWMTDLPLTDFFNVIGGMRYESTELGIVNFPDPGNQARLVLPDQQPIQFAGNEHLANVDFARDDVLPSIGFIYKIIDQVTLRGSYAQTIARQTFKELSPIAQQEYYGGDVFIGNPDLQPAELKNYDLRLDYTPFEGSLVSASYFYKDIKNPIEYVQRFATNVGVYTTPRNFPEGYLSGFEFEVRQQLGRFWDRLEGLGIGANATLIESEVAIPQFDQDNVLKQLSTPTRDMLNTPAYLYNLYVTYDIAATGTQFGLFYSVKGDTLVVGGGQNAGNPVPDIYETEVGSLNASVSQNLGRFFKLTFQAKNLTDPKIQRVYRSQFIDGDVVRTSYTKGIDLSITLSAKFEF